MPDQELQADYRARLFASLARLDTAQGEWQQVFQLLNKGELAAEQAEQPELVSRFQEGQQAVTEALRGSGQFLPWELEIVQLGLATGNVRAAYQRLAEHYQSQQSFYRSMRQRLPLPLAALAGSAVLAAMWGYWQQQAGLSQLLLQLLATLLAVLSLCALVKAGFRRFQRGQLPQLIVQVLHRLPGTGTLIRTRQTGHFLQNLTLCLSGGLSLNNALKLSARRMPDRTASARFMAIHRQVQEGARLSAALAASGVLKGIPVKAMNSGQSSASDAQQHLTQAVQDAYQQQLQFWAQCLPQLLYASLPLMAFVQLMLMWVWL